MQKDIAKGRGLLTILTLSFSYPYVSLHIMTLVTKCVVAAIPVRLISDFSEPVPMVCPSSLPPSLPGHSRALAAAGLAGVHVASAHIAGATRHCYT